jgi:hypothetical protein
MSEIKYRAWDGKKFIYSNSTKGVERLGWFFSNTKGMPKDQFIGLKDRNGVDIYGGDIDNCNRIFTYVAEMGGWYLMNNGEGIQWHEQVVKNGRLPFEVISNSHQPPELLCAKK